MEGLETSLKDMVPSLREMSGKMDKIEKISDQMEKLTPVLQQVSNQMSILNDRVNSIIVGISMAVFLLAGLVAVILFFNLWGRFCRTRNQEFKALQQLHEQGRTNARNAEAYERLEELLELVNNEQ